MRVTNQMLRQSAHKAGIQLDQISLLDVLNSGDSSDNLMSGVGTKNPTLAKLQKGHYTDIEKSSSKLNQYTSYFTSTDKNSLLSKAEKSGNTKDVVANVKNLVDSYNSTITKLKKTDSNLNKYYQQQMSALVSANKDKLKAVGITQAKDGTMNIDTKTLEKASLNDLKAAFGSSNDFTAKMEFVSGKVEQNAEANLASTSSVYNAYGKNAHQNSANRYNFLG